MNTLFDIVKEVFGLGKDLYNSVNLDELKKQHKRLVARTIWILTIIIILMVLSGKRPAIFLKQNLGTNCQNF
jgi:hypothetical protein